jgi:hypothetical protein
MRAAEVVDPERHLNHAELPVDGGCRGTSATNSFSA